MLIGLETDFSGLTMHLDKAEVLLLVRKGIREAGLVQAHLQTYTKKERVKDENLDRNMIVKSTD